MSLGIPSDNTFSVCLSTELRHHPWCPRQPALAHTRTDLYMYHMPCLKSFKTQSWNFKPFCHNWLLSMIVCCISVANCRGRGGKFWKWKTMCKDLVLLDVISGMHGVNAFTKVCVCMWECVQLFPTVVRVPVGWYRVGRVSLGHKITIPWASKLQLTLILW